MELTKNEIEMLQEQLILIYKTIRQNRMAKLFYFQDIETPDLSSKLINKINELEDPEEIIKESIMELEEMKNKNDIEIKDFNELLDDYDIGFLKRKYFIETIKDLDKLNIKELLCLL